MGDQFLANKTNINNNTHTPGDQPGHDILHKMRLILDHLKFKFWTVYMQQEYLIIYEAICTFWCTLFLQVHM